MLIDHSGFSAEILVLVNGWWRTYCKGSGSVKCDGEVRLRLGADAARLKRHR